jgi:hypothetical protein
VNFYFLNKNISTPANVLSGIAIIEGQSIKSFDVKLDDVEVIPSDDPKYHKDYLKIVYEDGSKLSSSATITYANLISGIKLTLSSNGPSGQSQSLTVKSPKLEYNMLSNNQADSGENFAVELNLVQYTTVNKNEQGNSPILLNLVPIESSYKLEWEIPNEPNISANSPTTILRDGESIGVSLDNTFYDEITADISIGSYQVQIRGKNEIQYASNTITEIPALEVKLPEQKPEEIFARKNQLLYQFCGEVSGLLGSGQLGFGPNAAQKAMQLLLTTVKIKAVNATILQSDRWKSKTVSEQACSIIKYKSNYGYFKSQKNYINDICCYESNNTFEALVNIMIDVDVDKYKYWVLRYNFDTETPMEIIKVIKAHNYFRLHYKTAHQLEFLESQLKVIKQSINGISGRNK